ncbi:MAG: sigma-54-dependent Fis family transcriptional regulator [Deltaproteobacteria bacterium]|nr:sigma-54-dependent Fis family transcriptional regulator [Deltaproteobacteria bacterium]
MSNSRTILVIDADPTYRRNAGRFLAEHGYTVFEADNANRGLEEARHKKPRFALVDLAFQASTGMDLVEQLRAAAQPLDVVCVARGCALAHVVSAVRAGALDVMERPVDGERLVRLLAQAALPRPDAKGAESPNRPLGLTEDPEVDVMVAESTAMRSALARARQLATRPLVMVVEGETGAGHEGLARAYHAASDRADGPFVPVPALPTAGQTPHDVLFGVGSLPSAFAKAKGGIVYIESLLSLGEAGQERVYKLLEGLKAARAAGTDVRWPPMVIGVERPLSVEVKAGRVKAELVDLLADAVVTVPPLRDRDADVPVLVQRVVEAIQAKVHAPGVVVDPAVVEDFAHRTWERNIPELISAVCRAAAYDAQNRLVLDPTLRAEPEPVPQLPTPAPVMAPVAVAAMPTDPVNAAWQPQLDPAGQVQSYDVYEAEIFKFALEKAGGCVSRAAELLGVGRATMYRKMRAYDIEVPPVSERTMARSRRARKRRAEERAQREARGPERHAS